MQRYWNRMGIVAFSVWALAAGVFGQAPEGHWRGVIATPGPGLGIEVTLERDDAGEWTGRIDIPVQGLRAYPLSDVEVEGGSIRFAMEGIPGRPTFSGSLEDDASSLSGEFTQGPQKLSFSLEYAGAASSGLLPPTPEAGVPGEGVEGDWLGVLAAGPARLRIGLHIEQTEEGGWRGDIDSLDQGVINIGIDQIGFEDKMLRFSISAIDGQFEGRLNEDGSALEGTWTQLGSSSPLTFLRVDEAVSLKRPQDPRPPFPYEVREVEFENAEAGLRLSGTYLVPEGQGPFPAVVFVSGSGPQDRDEALAGHRPFAVIADHLARRGIASLRFDDRGVGKSEGNHYHSTVEDFATDAVAALRFLAQQAEVDPGSQGIVGHSEGGLIGPMAANQAPELVDFLVLLAPPVEPLDRLLERQTEVIARLSGVEEGVLARTLQAQAEELVWVKDESLDTTALNQALRQSWETLKAELTEEELRQLQLSEARVEQALGMVSTPWFRSLMRIDPKTYLSELRIPVLALFGEKDLQVDAAVNAARLNRIMEKSPLQDHRVSVQEGLNHLFQPSATGAIEEYAQIEQTFDPATLGLIADWVLKRSRPAAGSRISDL